MPHLEWNTLIPGGMYPDGYFWGPEYESSGYCQLSVTPRSRRQNWVSIMSQKTEKVTLLAFANIMLYHI